MTRYSRFRNRRNSNNFGKNVRPTKLGLGTFLVNVGSHRTQRRAVRFLRTMSTCSQSGSGASYRTFSHNRGYDLCRSGLTRLVKNILPRVKTTVAVDSHEMRETTTDTPRCESHLEKELVRCKQSKPEGFLNTGAKMIRPHHILPQTG